MQLIRIITLPFLPIYAFITWLRTWSYNKGVIKSNEFDIPIITIGNLSVGGTGKTPHTEYLIRLLKKDVTIGVLSRGYRRKTDGYLEVAADMTAAETGDEPLQMKRKFPEIVMSVDKVRLNGITNMLIDHEAVDVILLDDAFQHRAVRAGINILLTTFKEPYFNDKLLPIGDLREFKSGKKRADIIVVTKCPDDLSQNQIAEFRNKISPETHQMLCFSKIKYGAFFDIQSGGTIKPHGKIVLVTGIANASPMLEHLKSLNLEVEHLEFRDHYSFSEKDIEKIKDCLLYTSDAADE